MFPIRYSGPYLLQVGAWRTGPRQVVSGPLGRERVHYEAPPADDLDGQMLPFLAWFNAEESLDPLLKAGLAHFCFVTIHPFDDGNGRMARANAATACPRSSRPSARRGRS